MRWFVHRLIAVVAIAFASMTAALVAPAVSSADCEHNMSWNAATRVCQLPPAPPAWYTAPPAYAPPFAAQDVPPPPPPPPWWAGWQRPVWNVGLHQWGVYLGPLWVPV